VLLCMFVSCFSVVFLCVSTLTVQELTSVKVGDHVRVKPTVVTPKYKWGSVTHNSVGTVTGQISDSFILDEVKQMVSLSVCMHVHKCQILS